MVRDMIAGFAQGGNPWSADPALSAKASEALVGDLAQTASQMTVQLASQSALARMQIVAAAKAGDPDAIAVLRTLLLECKSKRIEMPTELLEFDMWLTAHGAHHHRHRPGPKKKNYLLRDLCIAMTVAAVVDRYGHHGITATGRSPRRPRSACAIVAEALRLEAHLNIDYDAVKTIWSHYGQAMRTVAGWASR